MCKFKLIFLITYRNLGRNTEDNRANHSGVDTHQTRQESAPKSSEEVSVVLDVDITVVSQPSSHPSADRESSIDEEEVVEIEVVEVGSLFWRMSTAVLCINAYPGPGIGNQGSGVGRKAGRL